MGRQYEGRSPVDVFHIEPQTGGLNELEQGGHELNVTGLARPVQGMTALRVQMGVQGVARKRLK